MPATPDNPAGNYTSQVAMESQAQVDADFWSNINNNSSSPSSARFAAAINSTESLFDRRFREFGYTPPISSSSADAAWISELATKYGLVELYMFPRGIRDKKDTIGGQLSDLRQWVLDELDNLVTRGIDAPNSSQSGGITVVRPRGECRSPGAVGWPGWPLV